MNTLEGILFGPILMKLCQNVCLYKILARILKLGYVKSETRSPGQIFEKPCAYSRGKSFDLNFLKLCQNVYLHKI